MSYDEVVQHACEAVADLDGMRQRLGERRLAAGIVAVVRAPVHD
jgi:hypothetical protein